MITENSRSRPRGRPPSSGHAQRQALLQAAQEQLTTADVADLNLRQIALRAGVTPPLAHYYFGNRNGLLAALLEERAAPRIDALLSAAGEVAQPVAALTRLVQRLTQLVAADEFLRRCLLLPAATMLRARLSAGLDALLARAQEAGQLRQDLPRDYLGNALLGLCLYPFMDSEASTSAAADAAGRATALTLLHAALLQDGILARPPRA